MRRALLVALALALLPFPAWTQSPPAKVRIAAWEGHRPAIDVQPGHTTFLVFPRPVDYVAIGDTRVVNAWVRAEEGVVALHTQAQSGTTTLHVRTSGALLVFQVRVSKVRTADVVEVSIGQPAPKPPQRPAGGPRGGPGAVTVRPAGGPVPPVTEPGKYLSAHASALGLLVSFQVYRVGRGAEARYRAVNSSTAPVEVLWSQARVEASGVPVAAMVLTHPSGPVSPGAAQTGVVSVISSADALRISVPVRSATGRTARLEVSVRGLRMLEPVSAAATPVVDEPPRPEPAAGARPPEPPPAPPTPPPATPAPPAPAPAATPSPQPEAQTPGPLAVRLTLRLRGKGTNWSEAYVPVGISLVLVGFPLLPFSLVNEHEAQVELLGQLGSARLDMRTRYVSVFRQGPPEGTAEFRTALGVLALRVTGEGQLLHVEALPDRSTGAFEGVQAWGSVRLVPPDRPGWDTYEGTVAFGWPTRQAAADRVRAALAGRPDEEVRRAVDEVLRSPRAEGQAPAAPVPQRAAPAGGQDASGVFWTPDPSGKGGQLVVRPERDAQVRVAVADQDASRTVAEGRAGPARPLGTRVTCSGPCVVMVWVDGVLSAQMRLRPQEGQP